MTSPIEIASDHQMVPSDDENMPEDDRKMPEDDKKMPELIWNPARTTLAGDPPSPAPAASADAEAADVGSVAAEPGVADLTDAETPLPAWSPEAETDPVPVAEADPVPAAEAEPTPASPVTSDSASPSERWHEILAMFVDDPRASTELAAGLVDDNIDLLVVSVREQQRSLRSGWRGDAAGTEEMRTAVQHYRTFASRLEDFFREA
jgi:hypothetical protein